MRAPFGERLAEAVAARGPLCVGIDPHVPLLADWGLPDTPDGLARFTDAVVDALAGRVAVLKPQLAFYERHGSRGLAVLEDAVARARADWNVAASGFDVRASTNRPPPDSRAVSTAGCSEPGPR